MVKSQVVYTGDLHCNITHEPSGAVIATDAPKDNNGKGEAFSPTDLVAAALGACMMTVMGIVAGRHQVDMKGATVDLVKEMIASPERRIGEIKVVIRMPKNIPEDKRPMLEHAAHACPVHKSLHPDINIPVAFMYDL